MTAEFKISRLKYTWKGQWADNTVYNPDDVVSVGSTVYACLERHTSDNRFYNDLEFLNSDTPPLPVPKWEKVAEGFSFRSSWQTAEEYFVGDIVKVSNVAYICLEGHISAATPEQFTDDLIVNSYWAVFFSGLEWRNNWLVSTLYNIGDLVKWSGKSYICIESHTSATTAFPGLQDDFSKWEEFVDGIKWRGDWVPTTDYYLNDLVKYSGTVYRCNTQHTSENTGILGLEQNQSFWDVEHAGIEYRGDWTTNSYRINDIVKYGSRTYRCVDPHSVSPGDVFDNVKFEDYVLGIHFESVWLPSTMYQPGDVVKLGGFTFAAQTTNINSQPTFDTVSTNSNWAVITVGTRIRGDWTATDSYLVGDVVRRGGQLYSAKRNVTVGVDTDIIGDGSSINSDDWDLYIPGNQWTGLWVDDNTYLIGDLVTFRGAAYRCKEKHLSDIATRPDSGLGVYWDQFTYGDADNVLTDVGDLKKYGTASTENIAIGTSGQSLAVTVNQPGWKNFNSSNAVYFVSTDGVDDATRGSTLNSAWRTIRYALDNIVGPATLLVKSGTFNEILPLRVPASVAVVGDELRGTIVQPAKNYFSSTDIARYSDIIDLLIIDLERVVTKVTITKLGRVKQVITGTAGTIADINNINIMLNQIKSIATTGIAVPFTGSNVNTANDAATLISLNRDFLQSEAVALLRTSYLGYTFDESVVKSTVDKVLQAIINDLKFGGNYESVRAGNFLYNGFSADRNKIQNMFLLRDATGLRNMTLAGLDGELGSLNQFLTRRPTGGAYASLDPGWGPTHQAIWVGSRSPYVQNVTTFGNACVGLKVDGTLHSGGNKTIVSNDFTQILSDGIGIWVNGDGGTEAVSVFTYYNHIGYLCTDGGKIRGANGNCSYGEYGAVAEGFNLTEVPITGTVNNRFYDAIVGETFTDSSKILKLFYQNAGQEYTDATFTVTGAGINAALDADEFRDGAVHQVRLVDLDGSTQPFGLGYTLAINNAQAGDNYSIVLAAATDQLESDFQNMRIVIPSGTGAGQYGRVAAYEDTGKMLYVADERYSPWQLTSSDAGTNDVVAVQASVTYGPIYPAAGDFVVLTGTPFGGLANHTIYKITSILSSRIVLEDTLGAPIILTTGTGTMLMHRLGWNHFQPGYPIEILLNTTTLYSIEPRASFDAPSYMRYSETLSNSESWSSIAYGNGRFVAVSNGNGSGATVTTTSTDGINWTSGLFPVVSNWSTVAYGDGQFIALSEDGLGARSVNGITWTPITVPTLPYTGITYGDGVWVAVARDGNSFARSTNGTDWLRGFLPEGADWSSIAYGKGIFVTVAESDSTITNVAYTTDPMGGRFNDATVQAVLQRAVLLTPTTPGQIALFAVFNTINPATGLLYVDLSGINGIISSADSAAMLRIVNNASPTASEISRGEQLLEAVLASPNLADIIAEGLIDAGSWTMGSIPGGCISVTYGNNRFVAIEGGYLSAEKTFISFDGIVWQEGKLPAPSNWRAVAYGQGEFRAIGNFESIVAKSVDGLVWETETLSSADDYRSMVFGNPGNEPMFVIPVTGSNAAVRIKSNTQAQARVIISEGKIQNILIFEPGSGYTTEPDIEIFDPSNLADASVIVRTASGTLASPSIRNPGDGYSTISTRTTVIGDGFIDQFQTGRELIIDGAQRVPSPGDNLRITGIDDFVYKVISAEVVGGVPGNFTIKLVIAKRLNSNESPEQDTLVVIRQNYSQVRLTGHDFLDIGLGNFVQTNYPNTLFPNGTVVSPQNETKEAGGGRVFYTSTDQDGNFRCGELFAVEQSTGTVTISADFFELEGLEELSIGGISVGGSGVVIREFSSDQLFTADSNNIIPTQRAIKAYLTRRISGGGSDAFTATFTAGIVRVGPQQLSTTTLERLEFPNVVKFKSSYSGTLLAAQYFVSNNNLDDDLI